MNNKRNEKVTNRSKKVKGRRFRAPAILMAGILTTCAAAPSAMAAYADFNGAVAVIDFGLDDKEPSGNVVDPGNVELEDYLRSITPDDKSELLVQEGETKELSIDEKRPKLEEEGKNLIITARHIESLENNTADIASLEGTVGNIYPGAIVHADQKLADGCPNILPITGRNRRPLPLYLDISGNTLVAQDVSNVNAGTVGPKINEMLNNWFEGENKAAAKVTYKCIMVHSEKQVDMELGVQGAADKYGVDAKACMRGEKQQMLVVFNQTYYTVRTPQTTAAGLFSDNVTPDDFKKYKVDESNPGLAEVTSMSYGRQIIVKLETDSNSTEVEAAWRASVYANKIGGSAKYKSVMDNTSYSVCAYGGNSDTVGSLMESKTINEVNDALKADLQFTANTPAVPLSYSTTFIDDGTNATVNRATQYIATTRQVRKPITFEVDSASLWSEKSQCLYGRKITGVDENGKITLGGWEAICNDRGDVTKNNISPYFAEFGFEVDVRGGTDWP